MENQESFYNESDFEPRRRAIRLNDIKQTMPIGGLKVVGAKKQKTLDGGMEYPILTLEAADGNKFDVFAWPRDVLKCGNEWGIKDPLNEWGIVEFALNSSGTRYELVPLLEPIIEEKVA